jgi:hypothetical protein
VGSGKKINQGTPIISKSEIRLLIVSLIILKFGVAMSLAIALLGSRSGAVASDSIRVSPSGSAEFDYDKTFSLAGINILGAHVGLLEFSGRTIAEHVNDIVSNSRQDNMRKIAELIASQLIEKLSASEIIVEERKVEILFVGRKKFRAGRYEIRCIDIKLNPDTGQIESRPGFFKNPGAFVHTGDEKAREAAEKFLISKSDKISGGQANQLKRIAAEAIRQGIANCGQHPKFPDIPACGGEPCVLAI